MKFDINPVDWENLNELPTIDYTKLEFNFPDGHHFTYTCKHISSNVNMNLKRNQYKHDVRHCYKIHDFSLLKSIQSECREDYEALINKIKAEGKENIIVAYEDTSWKQKLWIDMDKTQIIRELYKEYKETIPNIPIIETIKLN